MSDLSSKTIALITGGNLPGLGYYLAQALLRSSTAYHVIITARTAEKAEETIQKLTTAVPDTNGSVDYILLDLEADDSISAALEALHSKVARIDVLINNAGIQLDPAWSRGEMTARELWQRSFNVNVTGTQIFTETVLPLLLASTSPRLLFLSSALSSLELTRNPALPLNKAPPAGYPKPPHWTLSAYRAAKSAVNMMMREWARELAKDGVKVFAVQPGLLSTSLGGYSDDAKKAMGMLDPAIGAEVVRRIVEGERDADVGKLVEKDGVLPW